MTPATVVTVLKSNYTHSFARDFDLSQCSGYLRPEEKTCTGSKEPCNLGCDNHTKNIPTSYYLEGAIVATEVLQRTSLGNYVLSYHDSVEAEWYFYMTDANLSLDWYARDFRAKTLAISTKCTPMTASCLTVLDPAKYPYYIGSDYEFHCPGGLNGSLLSNGATPAANLNQTTDAGDVMAGITFSSDAQLSTRIGDSEFASFQDPLYFGTWSVGWQMAPDNDSNSDLPWDNDNQIFYDYDGNYVWMLQCKSALCDVEYFSSMAL